jgi:hypothetical protein
MAALSAETARSFTPTANTMFLFLRFHTHKGTQAYARRGVEIKKNFGFFLYFSRVGLFFSGREKEAKEPDLGI